MNESLKILFDNLMEKYPYASRWKIERDGMIGEVVGWYITREDTYGIDLQQVGTRIVHVYHAKWAEPVELMPAVELPD